MQLFLMSGRCSGSEKKKIWCLDRSDRDDGFLDIGFIWMSGQMLTFVMLVLQSWIYGSVALNVCSASDPALTSFLTRFFAGASNSFTKETPVSKGMAPKGVRWWLNWTIWIWNRRPDSCFFGLRFCRILWGIEFFGKSLLASVVRVLFLCPTCFRDKRIIAT